MNQFRPGDRVIWWRRVSRAVEQPYRAEFVSLVAKRVALMVQDPDDASVMHLRHVAMDRVQPLAGYFAKTSEQGPAVVEPAASWGRFSRYLEIGEDLRPVRQVDVFENGSILSYDRVHWVDGFGMLGDARINRNRKGTPRGLSVEIEAAEFERVWEVARESPVWPQQVATAQMARLGAVPVWLTVERRRPGRT